MSTSSATFYDENQVPRLDGSITTRNPTVSGALATLSPVSTTGLQISMTRNTNTTTSVATDGTNNVASITVALSPDGTTYSTLVVYTVAAAINNVGALTVPIVVAVPAGWYLKLTTVHATLGALTYY
jgi:hypothetical protein